MNVIAVDDNQTILFGFEKKLREAMPDDTIETFNKPSQAIAYVKNNEIDIAFLDIEMRGMNGIELAIEIKKIRPYCNIIFVTGYKNYAFDAMVVRPSGYLLKPASVEDIREEINQLRSHKPINISNDKLRVQTFGNFEVYGIGGEILKFSRAYSKEIFAYLIDKRGYPVSRRDIAEEILEEGIYDASTSKKIAVYVSALLKDLKNAGYGYVVVKTRKSIYVDTKNVDCDLYHMMDGDITAVNQFHGEYLKEYSWAELSYGEVLAVYEKNKGGFLL